MGALTKIFFYLFLSVLIGALIAPFAYWIIASLPAHDGVIGTLIHSIQQMPFHRYESRSIQITAFVLLWPTIVSLNIHRMSDLYLFPNHVAVSDLCIGILVGIVPLWLIESFFLWRGWYISNPDFSFALLPKILFAAICVALFEEFIFRGVLLGLCRHIFKEGAAIVFTALIFAGIHFLNFPHTNLESVHWWSGLALLSQAGRGMPSYSLAFGSWITLFVVGLILAWVTRRTESLFLAIGLHASWIFGQQFFNLLASYHVEPANALLPWLGSSEIYGMVPVGVFTLFPLAITIVLLSIWLKRRARMTL